jgi:hypothetical protein
MSSRHNYISGLDGLRALAVVAVIVFHLFPAALPGGYIGVDLFFVISGFLITTLLIAEHARSGKVRLGKFWLRRARRLLPALFVTILVIGSVIFFVRGDIAVGIGRQIFGAATFSSNWMEIAAGTDYFSSSIPHLFLNFWSLGVEEQFYLVWPVVALLIVAGIKRPKIGMVLALLFALASGGWMAYAYAHGASTTRVYYGTDTHFFGLMIGAFLAFWARVYAPNKALRRLFTPFSRLARMPVTSFVLGFGVLGRPAAGQRVFGRAHHSHRWQQGAAHQGLLAPPAGMDREEVVWHLPLALASSGADSPSPSPVICRVDASHFSTAYLCHCGPELSFRRNADPQKWFQGNARQGSFSPAEKDRLQYSPRSSLAACGVGADRRGNCPHRGRCCYRTNENIGTTQYRARPACPCPFFHGARAAEES